MQQSCHRRWVSTTFPQPPKGRDTGENWATGWQKNAEWENRRKLVLTDSSTCADFRRWCYEAGFTDTVKTRAKGCPTVSALRTG